MDRRTRSSRTRQRRRRDTSLPQQRQRHIGAVQLTMYPAPIRYWALIGWRPRRRRKQQRFELHVIEVFGQRPSDPGRALAQPQAASHRPLRQLRGKTQSQDITDLAHRQSLGWHLVPLPKGASLPSVENCQRCEALNHRAGLITITGLGDHIQPECANIHAEHRLNLILFR
jgi:hypothetical protein